LSHGITVDAATNLELLGSSAGIDPAVTLGIMSESSSRHFTVQSGGVLCLTGLHLTGGKQVGGKGGTLYITGAINAVSYLIIVGCLIESGTGKTNNVAQHGGIIYIGENSRVNIEGSTLQNTQSQYAGAMWITGRNPALAGDASSHAHGTYPPTVNITSTIIQDCVASSASNHQGNGGAIRIRMGSILNVQSSTFKSNTGDYGGAIFTDDNVAVALANTTFDSNSANWDGGAIFSTASSTIHLYESTFQSNTASRFSGGVLIKDVTNIYLQRGSNTFTDNSDTKSCRSICRKGDTSGNNGAEITSKIFFAVYPPNIANDGKLVQTGIDVKKGINVDFVGRKCPAGEESTVDRTACTLIGKHFPMYDERSSGYCTDVASSGYIATMEACEEAASAIGFISTNNQASSSTFLPKGCVLYGQNQNILYFNILDTTQQCKSYHKCLCVIICQRGTYQDQKGDYKCKSCPSGFYSTIGASRCEIDNADSCPVGTRASGTTTVCEFCEAGRYNNQIGQSICHSCDEGRFSSSGLSKCETCGPGEYATDSTATSCKKCLIAKYSEKEANDAYGCVACPHGRYGDQLGDCKNCKIGTYNDATSQILCKSCDVAKHNNMIGQTSESDCKNCTIGTYNNEVGQSLCKDCGHGKFNSQIQQLKCKDCGQGKYNKQTGQTSEQLACTSCEIGKWSTDLGRTTDCAQCEKGKYNDQVTQLECKKCVPGKHNMGTQSESDVACLPCEIGTYNDAEGLGSACYRCPNAPSPGATSCDACLPGKYKPPSSSLCSDCTPGKFTDDIDVASCSKCPAGYHAKNFTNIVNVKRKRHDSCTGCPRGKYGTSEESIDEATGCSKCDAGRFSELEAVSTTDISDGIFCSPCASGKWNHQKGRTKESECFNCNTGRYSTIIASNSGSNCIGCRTGTYLKVVGADEKTDCLECPAGFVQERTGAAYCLPCTPGKHQHLEGKEKCTDCEIGRSTNMIGYNRSECLRCPIGQQTSNAGSAECQNCGAGKYGIDCKECDVGQHRMSSSNDPTTCVACGAGTYQSEAGKAGCLPCNPGRHQNVSGRGLCTLCTKGQYSSNVASLFCTSCSPGYYSSEEGQTLCLHCSPGRKSSVLGSASCSACNRGRFRRSSDNADSCVACHEGQFQEQTGQVRCQLCISGRYSDKREAIFCSPCAVGFLQEQAGASWCDSVPAGEIVLGNGSIAVAVPEGSFIKGSGGFAQCPSGWIGRMPATSSCTACEAGRSSAKGALSCAPCEIGRYSAKRHQEKCTACLREAGEFSTHSASIRCNQCPPGKVSVGTSCTDVAPDTSLPVPHGVNIQRVNISTYTALEISWLSDPGFRSFTVHISTNPRFPPPNPTSGSHNETIATVVYRNVQSTR
jgi:predicted outer membrane repeat protein